MKEYFKKVEEKIENMSDVEFIQLLEKIGFDDFINTRQKYICTANLQINPQNIIIQMHKTSYRQDKYGEDLYQINNMIKDVA